MATLLCRKLGAPRGALRAGSDGGPSRRGRAPVILPRTGYAHRRPWRRFQDARLVQQVGRAVATGEQISGWGEAPIRCEDRRCRVFNAARVESPLTSAPSIRTADGWTTS